MLIHVNVQFIGIFLFCCIATISLDHCNMDSCNALMQQKIQQSQISICAMAHLTIFQKYF